MKTQIKIATSSVSCFLVPMVAAAYFDDAVFNTFLGFVFGLLAMFLVLIIPSNDSEQ